MGKKYNGTSSGHSVEPSEFEDALPRKLL